MRVAQGPWTDLALHTLGWRAFQDLCAHVCEDVLKRPIEVYREAQDGGQDAVFAITPREEGASAIGTVQCKFSSNEALLGYMIPTLKVYVPTKPHVAAVRSLAKHGIVLLLGDPATGKSTIAAILATIATDNGERPSYKADGPEELLEQWNPHESGSFHWIDDAFGPNQLREDYVDRWISIIPKVQAAIAAGNKFVLTSRHHIYEAAKPKLGSKNHPLFRDDQAIVHVGRLTEDEKKQILYNHIKAGTQSPRWKSWSSLISKLSPRTRHSFPKLRDGLPTQHIRTGWLSM